MRSSSRPALRLLWAFCLVLCLGVAIYAATFFAGAPFRRTDPSARHFLECRPWLMGHITGGMLAIVVGPWQFATRLRQRRPALHRVLGYAYVTGALIGGSFGLVMAAVSMAGGIAHLGFGSLALLWLGTTAVALQAAKRGDHPRHRAWMMRSFALTLAGVTLRIELPAMLIGGVPFVIAYSIVAWSCWVPNLLIAEAAVRQPTGQLADRTGDAAPRARSRGGLLPGSGPCRDA